MKRNRQNIGAATVVLALFFPAQTLADQRFDLPRGCSGIVTIQLENCTVLNHWRCDSEPSTHYWVSRFDNSRTEQRRELYDGLSLLGTTVPYHSTAAHTDIEEHDTLMTTGRDTYDAVHLRESDGHSFQVQGESVLTGRSVTIDGIDLRAVRSSSRFTYPSGETSQKTVMQYIMPALPIWVPDRIIAGDTNDVILRFGPVDFIWPAEPDFMTRVPRVNCSLPLS